MTKERRTLGSGDKGDGRTGEGVAPRLSTGPVTPLGEAVRSVLRWAGDISPQMSTDGTQIRRERAVGLAPARGTSAFLHGRACTTSGMGQVHEGTGGVARGARSWLFAVSGVEL